MNRRNVYIVIPVLMPLSAYSACPDGTTAYLGPESNRYRNANGDCVELCGAGITSLNTSNGYRFDLFATRNTTPAINVQRGDTVCYIDLISGQSAGTLNIAHNDAIYHANPNSGQLCPASYTLSYSCGDGATGTPPESREMMWGDLYNRPDNAAGCIKPGYSFSEWKIDSTSLTAGTAYSYKYTSDKTMVAQWSPNTYGGAYLCNYCPGSTFTSSGYATGTYNSNFEVASSLSCSNPYGQTLLGYQLLDMYGNETGIQLTPGQSTTWSWPGNIQLRAVWSDDGGQVFPEPPAAYTLSYSCGDGATGTPPESQTVRYKLYYTGPYRAGTCNKPGYSLSGWQIDSTSISRGGSYSYNYTTDKTMVAQWTANVYGGAYLCNNGSTNSSYVSATFGNSITPSTTVCTAADGTTFAGYRVLDALGNDTGTVILPGSSWTWTVPGNIRLVALWE
ncbi:MAG: hypothetical protein IKJ62_03385 [Alphaproteobacteria bacterium]|nr:hypothetical protein [Alphaproteobacteria bacterium]